MNYSKEADWNMHDWHWHDPHPNPPLKGEGGEARKHWEIAKDMINKMDYQQRDKQAEEIEKQPG